MPITPSTLDSQQILQNVYDEVGQALRTDAAVTIGSAIKIEDGATTTKVKVKTDGVDNALVITQNSQPLPTGASTLAAQTTGNGSLASIKTNTDNLDVALSTRASEATLSSIDSNIIVADTSNVTVISTVLPTGASTSILQTSGNASLTSIDGKIPADPSREGGNLLSIKTNTDNLDVLLSTRASEVTLSALNTKVVTVDTDNTTIINGAGVAAINIQDGGNSITIDATSLPLPTGAATSTLQTTGNTSLSSIDGKITTTVDGIKVDGSAVTQPVSAVSLPLPTGAATSALQTTGNTSLSSIDGKLNSLGQKTMATSVPVVIASDQATFPVTANAGTNLNTSALALSATQTDRTQKSQITDGTRDGTVKAASTAAGATDTSLVVALSPNSPIPTGSNIIGALTANQSVNTAQINGVTPLMGNGVTGTGSQRVTIASDNTAFSVNATVTGTGVTEANTTISRVSSSASNVTLLASNTSRKMAVFYNDSTASCFVKFGTTASATSFTYKMAPSSTLVIDDTPIYNGKIDGIWDSANGAMQITESV